MVFAWGVVGFLDHRSRGSLIHAVASGAVVALVTFAVFYCAILLRINLFLEVLRSREDWTRLVTLFPSSGFQSFRAFANYDYAVGAPLKLAVATMIGAVTGLAGGLFSTVVDLTLGSRNSN
jgi:hypothetical protein